MDLPLIDFFYSEYLVILQVEPWQALAQPQVGMVLLLHAHLVVSALVQPAHAADGVDSLAGGGAAGGVGGGVRRRAFGH